ncbi:carboxymuconolactone decarboxylase family protein [Aquitalea aquatilis]|uniref:carboxymuconolactone decarboxylase family protein n=1 Tax=Aquitalea aquatilis TaxID=1537400 RepID=UPI0010BDDA16|nr:carboxymuconolactone decarboxylase family protein [Aquitalea aquatilis]
MTTASSNSMQSMATAAAKLANITPSLLVGGIWQRTRLSPQKRSIATVAALIARYRREQLPCPLQLAMDNGVSRGEPGKRITHLAF